MTLICEKCGCENHLNESHCQACGAPIASDVAYVVCGICGLSNPITAAKCIGCSEPLDAGKTFVMDKESKENVESLLSKESSVVFEPKRNTKEKSKSKLTKKVWLYFVSLLGLFVIYFFATWLLSDRIFYEAESGFYYVNHANELHVIDENEDDILIMRKASEIHSVRKYDAYIYFLDGETLYQYKKSLITISDEVSSYKVSLDGKQVLYTKNGHDYIGDLYLFANNETLRIDGNVGIDRYLFGYNDENIYYVTDITAEENLGVLYKKNKKSAPVKLAEDVYEPVLSLKKNTVYFVRSDFDSGEKYELYYVKDNKVTEIGRNIQHILSTADKEGVILVQEKNDHYALFFNEKDDVVLLDDEITKVGQNTFGDLNQPLIYDDELMLVYQKNQGANYILNKDKIKSISDNFSQFWFSKSKNHMVTMSGNELQLSKFKTNKLSETVSLATNGSYLTISSEGEAVVYENETGYYLMKDGKSRALDSNNKKLQFSENEKYLIYFNQTDCYALKLSAKEPVYLGENVQEAILIDKYVYTFTENQLNQYKLGKFSSNKEVDKIKYWSEFDDNY
ncbi:MAG: zinc ribbon domain-containing protein [Clostridia bacterium]|nr:zinc ribbon domain-containing protein [Clostridia bacterium]